MESTGYFNRKSTLARLLASENITVEHRAGVKTAWFDVVNRVLVLPIWQQMSDDLKDLLVVHEVGHALDTPADGWLESIKSIAKKVYGNKTSPTVEAAAKDFLNVVEDVRIDKRQKRRFPGSRKNYVKGYKELIEQNFFRTKDRDLDKLMFIDRVNIFYKGGALLGIMFSPEEKKVLARLDAMETFEEAAALAEELFALAKTDLDEQRQKAEERRKANAEKRAAKKAEKEKQEAEDEEESEEGESGASDDDEAEEEDESVPGSETSSDDAEEGDDEDEGENESASGTQAQKDDEAEEDDSEDFNSSHLFEEDEEPYDVPEAETEQAWQETSQTLIQNNGADYVYLSIPRPLNYGKMVHDYKLVLADRRICAVQDRNSPGWADSVRRQLQEFKTKENSTISYMVKEFEMRKSADEYLRSATSKTGVLDVNKLHSYKFNDDLFRRITTVATGKSHGFVMFLDWSSSMREHMRKTIQQLISLTMFCKRVQIPFEVYIFRDSNSYDSRVHKHNGETGWTTGLNQLTADTLTLRNILSSRMSVVEFNEALLHLYMNAIGYFHTCDQLTGTPLSDCVMLADLVINDFKRRTKVQIVNAIILTDGESTSTHRPNIDHTKYTQKYKRYFVQDEITKKSYPIPGYTFRGADMMKHLLQILKDRTNCNLIGFFVADGFAKSYKSLGGYVSGEKKDKAEEMWKSEGFYCLDEAGYDEYYIINPKMFNVTDSKLRVNDSMTNRRISSEFIKHSERKTSSRVLLNRFVKRITA